MRPPPVAAAVADLGSYEVLHGAVRHPGGSHAAIVATDSLDVLTLDAPRRTATTEAFGRLLRTLDGSLQVVVRVRRIDAEPRASSQATNNGRATAMQDHWHARLAHSPAYARSVLFVTRTPHERALDDRVVVVTEALRAASIRSRRLMADELALVAGDGLRIGCEVPWKEYAQHLEVGVLLARGYALRRLPGHPVTAGWLAPLLRVDAACDISLHLHAASLHHALSSLTRRLRDVSAHRLLDDERGRVADAHVDIALESTLTLRERLARNLGRPLRLSVTATVRGSTVDELRAASATVQTAFAAALVHAEPAHFRHAAAFVTTLPFGVDALHAGTLVDSSAATTCIPWVDTGGLDPEGYRLGSAVGSGAPVRLDPFDTGRHYNANVAVLAASGHGKSFAIGALVLEAADRGVDSVIVDPEGEYARVVEAAGGSTLELAPGSGVAVNIFDGAHTDLDGAVSGVVELVAVLCGGLDEAERATVDAAARNACDRARAQARVPVLGDCLPALDDGAAQIAMVVRRFCSGALGQLFNQETSARLDGGTCSVSLRELADEHMPAATFILARWLWELVRFRPRRRHIVFDEVGALCAHAALRTLLVQLARRCRKYGASLVVATQNARDLLATPEGTVVATNCATVLLGGHSAAETDVMQRAFGLTDEQRHALGTAVRGEFLVLAGDRRAAIRIDMPPLHRAILERDTTP